MSRRAGAYCDHTWTRDDQHTKQCIHCHRRKGVDSDE